MHCADCNSPINQCSCFAFGGHAIAPRRPSRAKDMAVGDLINFLSDSQTEKGPSSGSVIEEVGDYIVIRHGDHPGESFDAEKLQIKSVVSYPDGKTWNLI